MQRFSRVLSASARLVFSRSSQRRWLSDAAPSSPSPPAPWFIDPAYERRSAPPHLPPRPITGSLPPVPDAAPSTLKQLQAALAQSPHLEPATLLVCRPPETPPGPGLPHMPSRGKRRRRGGSTLGEGLHMMPGVPDTGGIWSWVVLAQVKEGTEKRGAIESVVRLVRQTLLKVTPPLPLPPNSKRKVGDGWAMIDAGDFAVHILSRNARETLFDRREAW